MPAHTAIQVRQKKEMVKKIIRHHLGSSPKRVEFKPAGKTNFVFEAECKQEKFIIRIGSEANKFNDYLKEQWAVEKADSMGIPVADILEIGNEIVSLPYMLQKKLDGTEATDHPDRKRILKEVGTISRLIHHIPTTQFGNVFDWSK